MNASRLFRKLFQAALGIGARRDNRLPLQPVGEAVAAVERAAVPPVERPAPVAAVAPRPEPPIPSEARLRSLGEVRADLARLRENARARHAQVQVRRDISFAPTDFIALAEPQQKQPRDNPEPGFAPVDFLDFGAAARPRRS